MTTRSVIKTTTPDRFKPRASAPPPRTSAIIGEIETTAENTVRLTFTSRVFKSRVPGFTAGAEGAETVESAEQISDTVVELVFTGAVENSEMLVGEGDAGLRTASGGFVPAGSYDLPAFQ